MLYFSSCSSNARNENEFYYNLDCTIVSINDNDVAPTGKFKKPTTCNVVLIRSCQDTTLYAKLSSCNAYNMHLIDLSDKNLYNKTVGSKMHFDYIKKDKFFKITNTNFLKNEQ